MIFFSSNMESSSFKIALTDFNKLYSPRASKAHRKVTRSQAERDKLILEIFKKHKISFYPSYVKEDYKFNKFPNLLKEIKASKLGKIHSLKERYFESLSPKLDKSPFRKDELAVLKIAYQKGMRSWSKLSAHLFKATLTKDALYRSAGFIKNHKYEFNHTNILTKKHKHSLPTKKTQANKKHKLEHTKPQEAPDTKGTVPLVMQIFPLNLDLVVNEPDLTPIDTLLAPADTEEVQALLKMSNINSATSSLTFDFYPQEKDPFDAISPL